MAEQVKSHQSCADEGRSTELERTGNALAQSGEETIDSGDENIPMLVDASDDSADEMHINDSRPGDRGCKKSERSRKMSDKVTLPRKILLLSNSSEYHSQNPANYILKYIAKQ